MNYYMTIFDYYNFKIKSTIEIYDINLNEDEETNATSTVKSTYFLNVNKRDIVVIKQKEKIIYWGIIEKVLDEEETETYTYTLKYITNLFDQDILLEQCISGTSIDEGYYRLKSVVDGSRVLKIKNDSTTNNEKIILWDKNSIESQIFKIIKENNKYKIKNVNSDFFINVEDDLPTTNGKNIIQNQNGLTWDIIEKTAGQYNIAYSNNNNYVIDIEDGVSANGTKIQMWENSTTNEGNRLFYFEKTFEPIIWKNGIEDFISKAITDNFISNSDTFVNLPYLELEIITHSIKNISVSNVENGIFNLHTFLSNCTQNYNIVYTFSIANNKLKLTIENKVLNRKLINSEMIFDTEEVFETDITSKVIVVTNSGLYNLYLLSDRTTTTDGTDENRADGKTEIVYTQNMEDANQTALNIIKQNSYNHNITFYSQLDLQIGQPISIRTKKSIIYDTYISSINITEKSFKKYTCGNIRINFIDKILQERNK